MREVPDVENWYCDDCVKRKYFPELLDWKIGKICHYCRRININCLQCTNKDCELFYCEKCLSDIFTVTRGYISAFTGNWKCLKCRNLCYCHFCLKDKIKKWKNDNIPNLKPPIYSGNEYLVKWKNKSYTKLTWIKEAYFRNNKRMLEIYKIFYIKYLLNNIIPSDELFNKYKEIEKIIGKVEYNRNEINIDQLNEDSPLYKEYIIKWKDLSYNDITNEYFCDIIESIPQIYEYNNRQFYNNNNNNRFINKPVEVCSELTEYQKCDVFRLIDMFEQYKNISFLLLLQFYIIIIFLYFFILILLLFIIYFSLILFQSLVCYENGLGVRVLIISYIHILFNNNHSPILIITHKCSFNKWYNEIKYWCFNNSNIILLDNNNNNNEFDKYEFKNLNNNIIIVTPQFLANNNLKFVPQSVIIDISSLLMINKSYSIIYNIIRNKIIELIRFRSHVIVIDQEFPLDKNIMLNNV